jgi:diadenosine tetraphosphatase ApaH/serine/threonine PP2A family protein phosphatase
MLACLYDVHGNLPALEAVLEDARAAGANRWVLGGDYALFGGWPAETVARLRELEPALWIRGNGERWTADPEPELEPILPAIELSRKALGDAVVAELGALPETAEDGDMLICHASPVSDVRSFLPEPADDDAELLAGVTHARLPFRRVAGSVELVNPGSVGMPLDGDTRAAYAVIGDDGRVEHRRVEYDHAASAAKVRAFGAEWAERIALRIETARLDQ